MYILLSHNCQDEHIHQTYNVQTITNSGFKSIFHVHSNNRMTSVTLAILIMNLDLLDSFENGEKEQMKQLND